MIIACPTCETSFALPDDLYRPGRKARCSNCGSVFPMPDFLEDPPPGVGAVPPPPPPRPEVQVVRKKHTLLIAAVVLICFVGIGYGGYMIYRSVTAPSPGAAQTAAQEEARRQAEFEALVRGIDLGTPQQFVVDNDKLGRMVVIQGTAVNNLKKAVDFITVEAQLRDGEKRPLVSVRQVCGVTLTLFQLQVLSEQELQAALNNKVVIYTNNIKVPSGGSVPFTVVFTHPPDAMASYVIQVADVKKSPEPEPADKSPK